MIVYFARSGMRTGVTVGISVGMVVVSVGGTGVDRNGVTVGGRAGAGVAQEVRTKESNKTSPSKEYMFRRMSRIVLPSQHFVNDDILVSGTHL